LDIRVQNVRKEFSRYPALNDVSLDIRTGELIALLGPSGSGKTTLLRLIAGLETPTAGQIFFGDEDASLRTVQQRNVGFVFQAYALFRNMTVLENISFGLKVRPRRTRPPRREIRRRAMELLDLVQLSDEPFGALDAQVRKELRKWLREIHDRTGHTTVFVTHDQEEALELADRLVVMSQGTIEQVGTPDEVYDRPNSPFVFGFIGESSMLPVEVANEELWVGGRVIGIPATGASPGAAQLYFRPHDVELIEGDAALAGVVAASRRVGGTRRVELEIGGQKDRVEIDLPFDHPAGMKTRIAFRPKRWRLFPGKTQP
jgi:sulfate transport system ATP-binding protein